MSEDPVLELLRKLTGGPAEDGAPIEPQNWDSVDVLELIAAIDEAHSVTVPIEQLHACTTVGELRQLIRSAVAAQ